MEIYAFMHLLLLIFISLIFVRFHSTGDAASDMSYYSSYYSEYDPFDYLYSSGTQYSDPVYEAVNKIERTPVSPSGSVYGTSVTPSATPSIQTQLHSTSFSASNNSAPPPLPPRTNRYGKCLDFSAADDRSEECVVDRRKIPTKLYENVIENKTYDAELVAFFEMVKRIRSQYKYTDEHTNVGHVVASEYNNHYPEGTEIKLIVHPLLKGCVGSEASNLTTNDTEQRSRHSPSALGTDSADTMNIPVSGSTSSTSEKGQIEGYGPPVVFTCDSEY